MIKNNMTIQQMQQIKREYDTIINDISLLINSSKRGRIKYKPFIKNSSQFVNNLQQEDNTTNKSLLSLLAELYNSYSILLSKEFLKNLITKKDLNKSQKVSRLLKRDNLTTEQQIKLFKEYTAIKKIVKLDNDTFFYAIKDFYGNCINSKTFIIAETYIKKSSKKFNIIQLK